MSDFRTIRYVVDAGICVITLARPDKRNAISLDMFRELGDASEAAGRDPGVRGVLVAGEGPSFCAGIDLELLAEVAPLAAKAEEGPDAFRSFVRLLQRPFLALATMPKPTLAAVQGHALGAGFQLALACDLRVGGEDLRFGMLEARFGLIPDLGGMYHLARMIGLGRAKELVWTTRTIEADEAERLGLANEVVGVADLATASEAVLRTCLAHSPVAVGLTKELLATCLQRPLEEELDHEADAQAAAISQGMNEA